MLFSNRMYDRGTWLVKVFLPALSALYFGLGNIWGLPAVENVVGSLAVIATFFGVLLGLSDKKYKAKGLDHQGRMVVMPNDDHTGMTYSLELNEDPEKLKDMNRVVFNVGKMPGVE